MTVSTGWVAPNSATLDLSNGAIVTETNLDAIASDLFHLGGLTGHIGARVYNSSAISIANNTHTSVTFNSERYDTDPNGDIHSTSSNTDRLTCRTAGKYLIWAGIEFDPNASGDRWVRLIVNGATVIAAERRLNNGAGVQVNITITAVYDLAAGDYVTVQVFQTSGGALNLASSANFTPELAMCKV